MSWTITYGASSVVLPDSPSKITKKSGANIKEIPVPGQNMLLVFGKKATSMSWDGEIAINGSDMTALIATYDAYLDDFLYHTVTLSNTWFDGTWVLSANDSTFDKGITSMYKYKLEFVDSATIIEVA